MRRNGVLPRLRLRRLSLVCLPLVCLLLVAPVALAAAGPAAAAAPPLGGVTVTGDVGTAPTVKFHKPLAVAKTVHRDLVHGTGEKVGRGDKVTFHYVVVDGRTGKQLESSFDKSPATIPLDQKQAVPGLVKSMVGTTVGTRVLVALAPREGVTKGIRTPGVKKNDTLLFVVDVTGRRAPLARATGTPVTPPNGLPKVRLAKDGEPTVDVPSSKAPDSLVVAPLVKGTGPVVEAGQTITVHYKGVLWDGGKQFDSSWDRGTPVDFVIGRGQVIAGWDEALVGQTVGSQVLLVVPPDKGYGSSGQPSAGISGTDTLVFVVDILDAY